MGKYTGMYNQLVHKMAFCPGWAVFVGFVMAQELWERRKVGQPPAFSSPDEMWGRALEYFQYCKDNPPLEAKAFNYQGETTITPVPKMRAMTQAGLCVFLNIGVSTWHDYKNKPEYSEVTKAVEEIMFEQKFHGAAAGLLNQNIIARDLGLVDRQEVKHQLTDDFESALNDALDDD